MYIKNRNLLMIAVVTALAASVAFAQHNAEAKKPASPPAKAEANIGGKKVEINYAAPSMRGRKIYGGLVPYGQVWRTGANAATTLTTEGDLEIGGTRVPAGTYTLFTLPTEGGWQLIISKRLKDANGKPAWGAYEYDQGQDLARINMQTEKLSQPVETFTISIDNGKLNLDWENTRASVDIKPAS
jgi:hypothetical protein